MGHPAAVFQRVDQAGFSLPIDERILADTDTLIGAGDSLKTFWRNLALMP